MASARTLARVTRADSGRLVLPAIRRCRYVRSRGTASMALLLTQQDRVVIEFQPQTWTTFDSKRMLRR